MAIKHAFTNAHSDGPDTSLVRPSNWNADHTGNSLGIYFVKDYGAVVNGSTDDTTAIQAAINAAAIAGGTVMFGPGFHRITATLTVPTGVHIAGAGVDATFINNESSNDSFTFGDGTLPKYLCFASLRDMTIDRNASATPSKAISINWATQVHFRDIKVLHHAYGVYGEFSDQNTFENLYIEGATSAAVRLGGPNPGHSSNLNRFTKCLFSGGPYGVLFEGSANDNVFIDTPFYSHTTASAYVSSSGSNSLFGNKFDRCWLEETKGFDLRSGSSWLFRELFFGNSYGDNPFQSTCVFDASTRILNTQGDGVLTALLTDFEFAESGIGGGTVRSSTTIGSNRSFIGESSHMANLSARGLAAYSFAAAGLGQGAKEKNLNAYPNLTDWTLISGTAVSGSQADPLGGTGACRLATTTIAENKIANANGGSALTGATFTIQCLVKSNGGKLHMQLTDDVNAGSTGDRYVGLPLDGWHVVSWTYTFPTGSTGTTLNLHLFGGTASIDVYWVVESLGRMVIPWLPAGCDMSGWSGPYEVFGPNHNVRVYGTAAPGSGTWRVGDQLIHLTPAASGNIGWVCTTAGTSGTWKTFGAIAA